MSTKYIVQLGDAEAHLIALAQLRT